jgi:peptidyl-prolyl cis-trans isomerase A (cyclophilin A)
VEERHRSGMHRGAEAAFLAAMALALAANVGCASKTAHADKEAAAAASPSAEAAPAGPRVEIVTKSGTIVIALDDKRAPKTVANFMRYVDRKFYDGGTFFRAVPGFVIQGGNRAHEKPSDPKLVLEPPISTGIQNKDGAISMARTTDPNSATSEFFICDGDQPSLDGSMSAPGYAAFGRVISGMDVVRAISRMQAPNEMLVTPVKIVKIVRVERSTVEPSAGPG